MATKARAAFSVALYCIGGALLLAGLLHQRDTKQLMILVFAAMAAVAGLVPALGERDGPVIALVPEAVREEERRVA